MSVSLQTLQCRLLLDEHQLATLLRFQRMRGFERVEDALLALIETLSAPEPGNAASESASKATSQPKKRVKNRSNGSTSSKSRAPLDRYLPDGADPFTPLQFVRDHPAEDRKHSKSRRFPDFATIMQRTNDDRDPSVLP